MEYSPIVALNRTNALSKANGKQEAIKEAEKLNLNGNHLYYLLLAGLYESIDNSKALEHLNTAVGFAKTDNDKILIERKTALLKALILKPYYLKI